MYYSRKTASQLKDKCTFCCGQRCIQSQQPLLRNLRFSGPEIELSPNQLQLQNFLRPSVVFHFLVVKLPKSLSSFVNIMSSTVWKKSCILGNNIFIICVGRFAREMRSHLAISLVLVDGVAPSLVTINQTQNLKANVLGLLYACE